jgi:hypothetical protein
VFVAGDQLRLAGPRQDRVGLGRLAGLARFDFNDLDGSKAERPARCGRPLSVVPRQASLGRGAQPADADQRNAQGVVLRGVS